MGREGGSRRVGGGRGGERNKEGLHAYDHGQ